MTHHPLISILVPVYKVELYIERCVRSIMEQSWPEIEYVFVNDCTPDNSIAVLQQTLACYPERADRVKIVHHPTNTGIAQVRNTLLQHATGEYILFIDSDDWIDTRMVEELYQLAEAENADITGCDYLEEYDGHSKLGCSPMSNDGRENIRQISDCTQQTYLYLLLTRRELYTQHGLRFHPGINVCEDYILCNSLQYYARRVAYLPKPLYHYFKQNSNSYSHLSTQNLTDRVNAIRVVEEFMKEKGIYAEMEQALHVRKFIAKKAFATDRTLRNLPRWRETFPESNHLCGTIDLGVRNNLGMWFAARGWFAPANALLG